MFDESSVAPAVPETQSLSRKIIAVRSGGQDPDHREEADQVNGRRE